MREFFPNVYTKIKFLNIAIVDNIGTFVSHKMLNISKTIWKAIALEFNNEFQIVLVQPGEEPH